MILRCGRGVRRTSLQCWGTEAGGRPKSASRRSDTEARYSGTTLKNEKHSAGPPALEGAEVISKEEYESIAAFRYAIRRFLRFSEQAARREGVTPQQHQLLLAIKGFPEREYATVSELADRLQMRQHSMVGLIDRTEAQHLVRREQGQADRRQVFIYLTPEGEATLQKLSLQHRRELQTMRQALLSLR